MRPDTRTVAAVSILVLQFLLACGADSKVPGNVAGCETIELSGGKFVVHYPPHLRPMARELESVLVESCDEIAGELGLEEVSPIEVFIVSDERSYEELHGGHIPEWSAAFGDMSEQRLVILAPRASSGRRPIRNLVRHELSHLLLAQRTPAVRVSTWFAEGLAMMQAREWRFADDWNFMILAGRAKIPYLEELANSFPEDAEGAAIAYGLSYLAVRDLLGEHRELLSTFTSFLRDKEDFEEAFMATFGHSPYDFASAFYVSVERSYRKPGIILNASPYWFAAASLAVVAFIARRVRMRRRLMEMEDSP